MTRISTTQANLASLSYFLRNQSELATAQAQVSTGKKATDLKGLVQELGTLNAARSVIARSENTVNHIKELEPKLAVQDTAFGQLTNAGDNIRQSLISSLGLDDGLILMKDIEAAFDQVATALNQKFAGRSLFGGTRVDSDPFSATTLDAVGAAVSVADLFQNSEVRPVSRIDQGAPVETGFLADKVATDLVSVIKAIKDFNDGADGPFGATLTTTQKAFIQTQLATIVPVVDELNQLQGENGLLQAKVETARTLEADRQVLLIGIIGDLEDADLAEAASRLQQAQTAVEASARTFNVLTQTSLLNFLR